MHHGKLTREQALGLRELRSRISKAKIPSSRLDETLLLATWNICEFGRRKRLAASLHYIAELIGQFDVLVLVELRDNVEELAMVQRYLGPYWEVLYSDYLVDAGGNRERIAVVYDTRAAEFTGFASHVFGPRANGRQSGCLSIRGGGRRIRRAFARGTSTSWWWLRTCAGARGRATGCVRWSSLRSTWSGGRRRRVRSTRM